MLRRRYHLDSQFLTLSLFVSMPLVTFGAFLVVSIAKGKLQSSSGQDLEQQALETKTALERYIGDRIVHLRLLSQDPQVVAAILEQRHSPMTENHFRILERAWLVGHPKNLTMPYLDSPLAVRLRETSRLLPAIKLLQVIDADGLLVASSSRAGRLLLNDRQWYAEMSREELFGAHVGEIQRSTSRLPGFLEIAYPIHDPKTGAWLGAAWGVMSANDLYAVLAPVRIGQTGRALLLRASDGQILASDETGRMQQDTFVGFSSIRTGMQSRRGYWIIPRLTEWSQGTGESVTEPARLVGFSVVDQIPGVRWIVVIEQSLDEATSSIRDVTRYLWIHFLGVLTAVFLLSVYLSLRQERPIIEDSLHLHEDHVPPSMQRRNAESSKKIDAPIPKN